MGGARGWIPLLGWLSVADARERKARIAQSSVCSIDLSISTKVVGKKKSTSRRAPLLILWPARKKNT